ncbi:hypothetical protein CBL_01868 [Carabus blaptoides fortunei]
MMMNAEREPDTATYKTLVSLTGDGQPPLAVAQQSERMRRNPRASPDGILLVRSRSAQCAPTHRLSCCTPTIYSFIHSTSEQAQAAALTYIYGIRTTNKTMNGRENRYIAARGFHMRHMRYPSTRPPSGTSGEPSPSTQIPPEPVK